MTRIDEYRAALRELDNWDSFLLEHSGLPSPRGNIELAQAVADEGNRSIFERYLSYSADQAPVNSPYEFLAFCGAVGMGSLAAKGDTGALHTLRTCASDSRWRMREGVAMGLQRLGDVNMDLLIKEMETWSQGTPLEQRAAAAALCEPRLLHQPAHVHAVLQILDHITASILHLKNRRTEDFLALRKGLGYCWSVAVAASLAEGKILMEKWCAQPDKDIRWIMRENLKKNRLIRIDANWVEKLLEDMSG